MLSEIESIVLIGAGKMGMALAHGWLEAGLPGDRLILVDPAPHPNVQAFAEAKDIQLVPEAPDRPPAVMVLAVKPQIIDAVMVGLQQKIGPDTLVLSIAAGKSVDHLAHGMGSDRVVRTMPNLPAQVGKGVTGIVFGAGISNDDKVLAQALLSASGLVVVLPDESDIDALTAVSGSGPAYVFLMVEALAAAGQSHGLSAEAAMVLARQTIIGAAALLDADPTDAGTLRENVTSPKGVTAEALAVLMADDGLAPLMERAVAAARKRSREIGG